MWVYFSLSLHSSGVNGIYSFSTVDNFFKLLLCIAFLVLYTERRIDFYTVCITLYICEFYTLFLYKCSTYVEESFQETIKTCNKMFYLPFITKIQKPSPS